MSAVHIALLDWPTTSSVSDGSRVPFDRLTSVAVLVCELRGNVARDSQYPKEDACIAYVKINRKAGPVEG